VKFNRKYDPENIASFKSIKEAIELTGISHNNYYYLRKKWPQYAWPFDNKPSYDPVKISKFKSVEQAIKKTGIKRSYYRTLMLRFPDLPWPAYAHLPRKFQSANRIIKATKSAKILRNKNAQMEAVSAIKSKDFQGQSKRCALENLCAQILNSKII
jgi:hypothetical protein